ncbi:MAG: T9SS type A sorting domain-containing protein [Ignavibacteriales bacterium]|nr:T9SS type A sorting domain-containing protein [Ignavibacteriales bacterium]
MKKINFIIVLNIAFIIISLTDVSLSQSLPTNKQDTILSDTSEAVIVKDAFRVNSSEGEYGADQSGIRTAIDGEGNFAFVWIDQRHNEYSIYCQFYNQNKAKIGDNIKVNDSTQTSLFTPAIDANVNGDFVIAWARDAYNIEAQRFNNVGQKIGSSININLGENSIASSPDVAVNSDGSFVITWVAFSTSSYRIYSRFVSASNNLSYNNTIINDSSILFPLFEWRNSIDVDGGGNYYVAWNSSKSDSIQIILQKINSNGSREGSNIIFTAGSVTSFIGDLQIKALNNGNYLIAWFERLSSENFSKIKFRIFNSNTNSFSNISNITYTSYGLKVLDISTDRDSTFYMVFGDYQNALSVEINILGELKYSFFIFHFNTDYPILPFSHCLTNVVNDSFYLAAVYSNVGNYDLGFQKFASNFYSSNEFEKINDDSSNADQKNSLVKFNNKGESIIVWEDQRNGGKDLYAQVYDPLFNPIGGNIRINEGTNTETLEIKKSIGSFSDGTFVIGFNSLDESYVSNFYLQRVSTTGEKVGSNVFVKTNTSYPEDDFSFGINNNDELLFCWYDNDYAAIRRINSELTFISSSKTIKQTPNNISFNPIKVSIDTSLNILLTWKYYYDSLLTTDKAIYGETYNKYGDLVESQFTIDYSYLDSYYLNLVCKNDGLNAVILFQKDYNQYNLVRRYNDGGIYKFTDPINSTSSFLKYNILKFENKKTLLALNEGSKAFAFYANDNHRQKQFYHLYNYPVDNYTSESRPLSIDCKDDNFILSYETAVSYTGEDIWSSIVKVDSLNMEEEFFFTPPTTDFLYNNFPNPFNPTTKIVYEILAYHQVKLSILNILGEEVRVLVNENQEKGLYEVEFNATDLASGVYFCKLEAFNTTVKKMMVLK